MALPKYDELYVPFLTVIKDGQVHVAKVVKESRFGGFSQPWKLCHYTGREKAN